MYRDSDKLADMSARLLLGVMASAEVMGFALWGGVVKLPPPLWDGVVGWDADPKKDLCHFFSSVGDDGESVGDEIEVEDVEEVILEVSSAPEDVTSWRGLDR